MAIPPERVAALRELHGRVEHVKSKYEGQWEVVLRKPKRAEYKAFRAGAQGNNPDAQENLVRQLIVEPEGAAAIDALIEDYAGIPEACSDAIFKLTGMKAEELAK